MSEDFDSHSATKNGRRVLLSQSLIVLFKPSTILWKFAPPAWEIFFLKHVLHALLKASIANDPSDGPEGFLIREATTQKASISKLWHTAQVSVTLPSYHDHTDRCNFLKSVDGKAKLIGQIPRDTLQCALYLHICALLLNNPPANMHLYPKYMISRWFEVKYA